MTKTQPQSKRPDFEVFVVEGEGKNAYWTQIGRAWRHDDGDGINVRLSALPFTGKLVLRTPKTATKAEVGQ
jgi:hypothetical protein